MGKSPWGEGCAWSSWSGGDREKTDGIQRRVHAHGPSNAHSYCGQPSVDPVAVALERMVRTQGGQEEQQARAHREVSSGLGWSSDGLATWCAEPPRRWSAGGGERVAVVQA